MNQPITQYLQNQLVRSKDRLLGNTHDTRGKKYPQRHVFLSLKSTLDNFIGGGSIRWVVIPGLRGIGKTTVVSQLYFHLVQEMKIADARVLYVSLDEVGDIGGSLRDVLDSFEYLLGESYESLKEPVFIFLDEVQADSKWATTLKILFERSKKVFILCTGSSAVELQSTADVERRAKFQKMFPMSFGEFEMVKNDVYPTPKLKAALLSAVYETNSVAEAHESLQILAPEIARYWSRVDHLDIQEYLDVGTLPFALGLNDRYQVYQAIRRLLEQVIDKDIQSLNHFQRETVAKVKPLLHLLAEASDVLTFSTIANTIDLQRPTLNDVFDALEKTELLIRILPYGSNKGKITKPSKFLFTSPAIRQSLITISGQAATQQTNQGRLLEDIVGLHLYKQFVAKHTGAITYDAAEGGADFILQMNNRRQMVIEVGMNKKDTKQVKTTMAKVNSSYGVVISANELGTDQENKILFLPLDYFLLM